MDYETLEVRTHHRVAVVWMTRETVRNAFNETSIAELTAAFAALGADADIRAIVLAGRGPAFCAGADLAWMKKMAGYSDDENRADAGRLAAMLKTIYECPKPIVARVHGDAYAGGVGLVAVCDVAVAAIGCNFCLSETRLGLIPATIGPYVVQAIGARAARRYFLTAERFDAAEAFRIGLVHDLAPPAELDAKVNEVLGALMQTSATAVAESKRLVRDLAARVIDDRVVADTVERIAAIRASDDGCEGVRAFLEKRKSRWLVEYESTLSDPDEEEM
jgi:methylglutaconyl-CoA hydratase